MKYKNLLFDLDGTLTDSSEGIIKSVLYTYEKMQLDPPEESVLHTFIGPPLRKRQGQSGRNIQRAL